MKKHIKLAVLSECTSEVRFQIAEQTHRGKDFGGGCDNAFGKLCSSCYPMVQLIFRQVALSGAGAVLNRLYVRGDDPMSDNTILRTTPAVFEEITQEVIAYNDFEFKSESDETIFKPLSEPIRYVG